MLRSELMNLVLRCIDGVVLEVIPGRPLTLEVREPTVQGQLVSLPSARVRACFEGAPLARAHAVANLTPAVFNMLAGESPRERKRRQFNLSESPHYKTFDRLRYIGRRITDPLACEHLMHEPLATLHYAARWRKPAHQILAAFDFNKEKLLAAGRVRVPA